MGKVVKSIANVATFGVLGSLLGGKKKAAAPVAGPIVMPLPDDAAVATKRKRDIAAQLQRGGRSSTILSDSSDNSLGGGF